MSKQNHKFSWIKFLPHLIVFLLLLLALIVFLNVKYDVLTEKDLFCDSGKCISLTTEDSGNSKYNFLLTLDNGKTYYIELNISLMHFSRNEFEKAIENDESIYVKYSSTYNDRLQCYEIAELYSDNQVFVSLDLTNNYRLLSWLMLLLIYFLLGGAYLYFQYLKIRY